MIKVALLSAGMLMTVLGPSRDFAFYAVSIFSIWEIFGEDREVGYTLEDDGYSRPVVASLLPGRMLIVAITLSVLVIMRFAATWIGLPLAILSILSIFAELLLDD